MTNLVIEKFEESLAPLWDAYVTAHEQSSIYHLSLWKSLVEKRFGHQTVYLCARRGGDIVGVLPAVRLKSVLFGDYFVSMPYFNYGGALADSADIAEMLMSELGRIAGSLGSASVEFRDTEPRGANWPVKASKVAMILELPPSLEDIGKAIGSKKRSQVRRPLRENPQVVRGRHDLLDDFYDVFAENMRDLGTPVYSKAFFRDILDATGERSTIIVIRLQGKPVSAAFLLGFRHTLEIPWASTLREVNPISMNMLLYWEVLGFAIERKYRFFDFGRSTQDAGTYRFKQQWGATPRQLYWHYWLAPGSELPQLNPDNPKYRLVIAAWQRLPLWVTRLIGPAVVKNLP
jgi:serine/alanine adding enzyme